MQCCDTYRKRNLLGRHTAVFLDTWTMGRGYDTNPPPHQWRHFQQRQNVQVPLIVWKPPSKQNVQVPLLDFGRWLARNAYIFERVTPARFIHCIWKLHLQRTCHGTYTRFASIISWFSFKSILWHYQSAPKLNIPGGILDPRMFSDPQMSMKVV